MPNTQAKEKPVSRRLERQVRQLVNAIFMEVECSGCHKRASIHDMELNVETGEYTCEACFRKREAVDLIGEGRIDAAIKQLQHVAA
jgi:hypothetical protein